MWWAVIVLFLAAAAGALLTAVFVARPGLAPRFPGELRWIAPAGAGAALGLSDAAPTGWEPFDLVLRVVFGVAVPLAAARAGTLPTAWLTLVTAATAFVALDAPRLPAGVALGSFLALAAGGGVTPAARAVAAAVAVGSLGFVDWPVATGASAIATALATLPALVVGWARAGRPRRRQIGWAFSGAVLVLVVGSAAGLLAALSAESDITRAVDLAGDGIDQLGDDDAVARRLLLDAAGGFESAEDTLTTWWGRAALVVPGVAQQARAVTTMASAGADLAQTAAEATEDADIDSVRPVDGRVDLDALRALADPLDRAVTSLRRADARLSGVRSPLLLGPVGERLDELRSHVAEARTSAELAAQAVEVAPGMLGADGPRRYFLAFQNPSELRGNGGFMGNWAEIVADDGQLSLSRNGRVNDLRRRGAAELTLQGMDEVQAVYGASTKVWGLQNFTPDNPTASALAAQLYEHSTGAPVDGVISLTPTAVSGLLELTGPVQVPGYPEPLSAQNVERVMLHDQYLAFPQDSNDQRTEFLSATVDEIFDRLTSGPLPGPSAIGSALGPAVEGRHLQLWSPDAREQALYVRLGADGSVERRAVDSFGIATQNFGGNKIDWFQRREVAYDVEWHPRSGEVAGSLTATITNDAPAAGLPSSIIGWGGDLSLGQRPVEPGENFTAVALYTTFPVDAVTVDGEAVAVRSVRELGHHAQHFFLSVPPGGRRVVRATFRGVSDPSEHYVVEALRQPTIHPDDVSVAIRAVDAELKVAGRKGELTRENVATLRANARNAVELRVEADAPDPGSPAWLDRLRGDR